MSASPFAAISPGTPCFSFSFRADGGDEEGWGGELGSPSQPSFYRKSASASAESCFFFRTLVDVAGTMCLTCLAGDVMEQGAEGSAQLPPAKFGSVGRVDGRVERSARSYVRARAFYFSPTSHHSAKRTSPQNRFAHHPPAAGRGSSSVSFSSQSL